MTNYLVILDPSLLIWDQEDYDARSHVYWRLAEDFILLLDTLDESPFEVILSATLAEEIIAVFPADQLTTSSDLRDFVSTVYIFLAKAIEESGVYSAVAGFSFMPDVCNKNHLSGLVAKETSGILEHAFKSSDGYFASHSTVWTYPDAALSCLEISNRKYPVLIDGSSYAELRASVSRIYQAHDKHDPIYGYGSRLPTDLSEADIQQALNVAIEIGGGNGLCAKCQKDGTVLIFRRHHKNFYHAYPIESSEYSKYGINHSLLPIGETQDALAGKEGKQQKKQVLQKGG